MHEVLNTRDLDADVVLCLGFLYHTLRYNELLDGIRRTHARYLIIDTFSPHMMRPVPNVNVITEYADEEGKAAADAYTHGPSVLVGRPNLAAIQTMLGAYGYRVERLSDWAGLLRDNPATETATTTRTRSGSRSAAPTRRRRPPNAVTASVCPVWPSVI